MIVHVVWRDEQPLEKVGVRGAGVAQGIAGVGNDRMLGDVADARNHHHPGQQRQQPQQRIGPPHAGSGKARKQQCVDDKLRTEFFPEMRGALRERPFLRPERIQQLRLALLVSSPSGDIAQELAAVADPGDRERRRQNEIRIVFLLRTRMMLQVIAAIGAGLGKNRIGAKPLAERQIDLLVRRQASMRAVMHQDGEPELARTDDADRQQKGQRIGPPCDQRNRPQYQRPCMRDQGHPLPRHALTYGDQLILAQKVTGTHAKRGHDDPSPVT